MLHLHAGRRWSGAGQVALKRWVLRLTTDSLILYLCATLAQRTWILLNTDVGQWVRRLY